MRTCRAGYGDCDADLSNGCEAELRLDPQHCGACGVRCAGNEVCSGGRCIASPYTAGTTTAVFAPTTSTTLPAGVHRFASMRIPAGVRVSFGAPGIAEVCVRGGVVIDGTLDVSGGDGGDGAVASATCVGGNGGGGGAGTGLAGRADRRRLRAPPAAGVAEAEAAEVRAARSTSGPR